MATRPFSTLPKPTNDSRLPIMLLGVALIVIVIGAILATVLGRSAPFVPEVIGAPHAAISSTLIDHGDVQMDDYVESVFRIQNTGDETLRILQEPRVQLVQGCCPPRAIVSDSTLQPGETTTITLRFTMHDMMGGPHEFRVFVPTNDPTQEMIALTILSNWVE